MLELFKELGKDMELKFRGILGPRPDLGDVSEIVLLNRILRYADCGGNPAIEWEADPRHAEIIVKQLGLKAAGTKSLSTPGDKLRCKEEGEELKGTQVTKYRSLAMTASFLVQDYSGIQYATKELAREMKTPTVGSWGRLKHLGRYLLGASRVVQVFKWQKRVGYLYQGVDSNHAGCLRTCKSTSSGTLFHGVHCLRSYSATQGPLKF